MQRAAGKMFYQWAEVRIYFFIAKLLEIKIIYFQVLGQRLEEMMNEDKSLEPQVLAMVTDEQKQRELLVQDDEEDFLDEG